MQDEHSRVAPDSEPPPVWTALDLAEKIFEARSMFQDNLTYEGSIVQRSQLEAKICWLEGRLSALLDPAPARSEMRGFHAAIGRETTDRVIRYEAEAPTAQEACDLLWQIHGVSGDAPPRADMAGEIANLKAEAGMMRDAAGDEASERMIAEQEWEKERDNLKRDRAEFRDTLHALVVKAHARPNCFVCTRVSIDPASGRVNPDPHAPGCPIAKAVRLLEGTYRCP